MPSDQRGRLPFYNVRNFKGGGLLNKKNMGTLYQYINLRTNIMDKGVGLI